MTVSSSVKKDTYAGNGVTTVFNFTFPILAESNILVEFVNDTTGVVTSKTLTTDYTVSGTGNDTGSTNYTSGSITVVTTTAASGETLVIKRSMPLQQNTDYAENDAFPAETHEEALDELTMNDLQLQEEIDRSVKFDSSVTSTVGTIGTPGADKYLKRNSANDSWEFATLSTSSGLGNVVEDISPQLGGNLDTNSKVIVGSDVEIGDGADATKKLAVALSGATTAKTATLTSSHTDDRTITLPDATDTLVGKATTDTFTNKTFDANGTGNSLSNVDVADLANGTDGELITWDAAGAPTTVPVGTATHVLTSNGAGAAPTFQAPGGVSAASQAEQETGSSTSVYVSPGRQQYHPSAAKGWCKFDGTGTAAIDVSYNVTSITDNGTGDYTVTWATDFSSAEYNYSLSVMRETGAGGARCAFVDADTGAPAAGSIRFLTGAADGTFSAVDLPEITVVGHGDQ